MATLVDDDVPAAAAFEVNNPALVAEESRGTTKVIYNDAMDQTHKSSEDKTRVMMKHLDYMLKNNTELECPALPGTYVDTVG
eukprot:15058309-Ditylum_brightwellii.AAC.1